MSDSFEIPGTVVYQAPLSMGFSGQEYQNGLPFPSPGDLPDPGIEPASPAWLAESLPLSQKKSPNIDLQNTNTQLRVTFVNFL